MLTISSFTLEGLAAGCVTDAATPRFDFQLESDGQNVTLQQATLTVGDWQTTTQAQIALPYGGKSLSPFRQYIAHLTATANTGETASAELTFETGRMGASWAAAPGAGFTNTAIGLRPKPKCGPA